MSEPEKKNIVTPKGSTSDLTWTSGKQSSAEIEVLSANGLYYAKEKPAAEIFHTYYKMAEPKSSAAASLLCSTAVPARHPLILHIGGLGPQRVFFEADGNLAAAAREDHQQSRKLDCVHRFGLCRSYWHGF